MIDLVLPAAMWFEARSAILDSPERCAILLTSEAELPRGGTRLMAYASVLPDESEYTRRGPLEAELTPAFVARVTKMAKLLDCGIVFVHSHTGAKVPTFSATDSSGERCLAEFLAHRHPTRLHSAMVVSDGGLRCRRLGSSEAVRVTALGADRKVLSDPFRTFGVTNAIHDRQIRALGSEGQDMLERLTIGIVGLGGTGSIVAQQLVHLGIRNFILIDPDTIELSNLNRVANATSLDVGVPKVEIARRYITAFSPDAQVAATQGDVIWARDGKALLDADLIFGCTDSHGSRAVLEQICYQYLVPLIDLGVVISVADGHVNQIVGRVQMLSPGLACFTCTGLLDPQQVRRDMMNAFERQSDPYIQGGHVPAPAVMSINGTVASLAVTMSVAAITGFPVPARSLVYRAHLSSLRAIAAMPESACLVCSHSGRQARGDSWPFPGRQD